MYVKNINVEQSFARHYSFLPPGIPPVENHCSKPKTPRPLATARPSGRLVYLFLFSCFNWFHFLYSFQKCGSCVSRELTLDLVYWTDKRRRQPTRCCGIISLSRLSLHEVIEFLKFPQMECLLSCDPILSYAPIFSPTRIWSNFQSYMIHFSFLWSNFSKILVLDHRKTW